MNYKVKYLHCEKSLLESLKQNIEDVFSVINSIEWEKDFEVNYSGRILRHQTAYNKVFEIEFEKLGWEKQPLLSNNPKLIGDFKKKYGLFKTLFFLFFIFLMLLFSVFVFFEIILPFTYIAI